jgi:hypothetical protein
LELPWWRIKLLRALEERAMRLRSIHLGVCLVAAGLATGCSDLGALFGEGEEEAERERAMLEQSTVWEMTIHAGRYSVMLDQVRSILKLPEPATPAPEAPPVAGESLAERRALAAQQVLVASEFYGDVARACARKRVPKKLRQMACAFRGGVPRALRSPAALDVAALSARNEALDKIVLPWWDAACATVPNRGPDDEPICPME